MSTHSGSSSGDQKLDYKLVDTLVLNMLKPPTFGWYVFVAITVTLALTMFGSFARQFLMGLGANTGINNPIGWGFFITNFVFWVGIAHSGTLISAVLYLFRAKFRMPIYRVAEAMTVFAVATAGLFPIIHTGRPWFAAYWLFPYPNQRALWPNFKSPLMWDVFAISTYFTVSFMFFVIGLIPDIATARDAAKTPFRKFLYTVASLGWKGNHDRWKHYSAAYLLFASFAAPLVVSVHSVVSWDFAMGLTPGWHATIFPPYFVAGAIFSGVAMVLTIVIPMRKVYGLEALIREEHFDAMCKLIMLTSGIVTYAYLTEFYVAWFSNNIFERYQFWFRPFGEFAWAFWMMAFCNCMAPLLLWIPKLRKNLTFLFILSIVINIGMWFERFNIIFTSLSREFIPAAWGGYVIKLGEILITAGAFGWFGTFMLVFIKFFPAVAITEIKEILPPPVRDPKGLKHH
jgi:Ni/Fe-hydrogenase subunit HybB-like protein